MKRKLFIFLLIGALPLTALEGDRLLNPDPKLPPITEGNNTMGCKINGKVWDIMRINGGKNNYYQSGLLFISGEREIDGKNTSIAFAFSENVNIEEGKTYSLTDDIDNIIVDLIYRSCHYERHQTLHGSITLLRFDTKARIVSGTFEFTTYNPECGDTVRVTDGRFDFGHLVL